jgi:hypothetical protein
MAGSNVVPACRRTDVIAVLDTIHDDAFAEGSWLADLIMAATAPAEWQARLESAARAERLVAAAEQAADEDPFGWDET